MKDGIYLIVNARFTTNNDKNYSNSYFTRHVFSTQVLRTKKILKIPYEIL